MMSTGSALEPIVPTDREAQQNKTTLQDPLYEVHFRSVRLELQLYL